MEVPLSDTDAPSGMRDPSPTVFNVQALTEARAGEDWATEACSGSLTG